MPLHRRIPCSFNAVQHSKHNSFTLMDSFSLMDYYQFCSYNPFPDYYHSTRIEHYGPYHRSSESAQDLMKTIDLHDETRQVTVVPKTIDHSVNNRLPSICPLSSAGFSHCQSQKKNSLMSFQTGDGAE
jgi:hypothetical protein